MHLESIPEISAIYFGLLQCGYEFCAVERNEAHMHSLLRFLSAGDEFSFFAHAKQNTCAVYPYWPRAAILETAALLKDPESLRKNIFSATNISDAERDKTLWDWLEGFSSALKKVMEHPRFKEYLIWENEWIAIQGKKHADDMSIIGKYLEICVSKYGSPVRNIKLVINPIKCVYSADYHLADDSFIYTSGILRRDSVLHEFLHHLLHPYVTASADIITRNPVQYPGVDASYYSAGALNAFEEHAVRTLTDMILKNELPHTLDAFIYDIALRH